MKVVGHAEEMERFAIGLELEFWEFWRLLSGVGPKAGRRVEGKAAMTARTVGMLNSGG